MAVTIGAAALLYLLLQFARSALRDERKKAQRAAERADAAEALRNLERDVQAARGVTQEKARETEQDQQARQAVDDRPDVFGDPRLHERSKDRL